MTIRIAFVAVLAFSLVACGGGASSHAALPGIPGGAPASVGNATAQFVIKVPPKQGSATGRGPAYVSPSTQSISIQVDSGTPSISNLTPGSSNCNVPAPLSPLTCTVTLAVASGAHTFTVKTYDGLAGAGNALSVNSAPFTVVANQANLVNITLAGVPANLLVEPATTDLQMAGSGVSGFEFTGETPHTIVVLPQDADGNLILGPGAPTIAATLTGVSAGSGLAVAPATGGNPNAFTITSTGFGGATLALVATPAAASAGSALNASVVLDATVDSTVIAGNGSPGYADGTGSAARFGLPSEVAVDTANNDLYVSDMASCAIRQVTAAGVVTSPYGMAPPAISCGTINGTGNAAQFDQPTAVAYDPANGNLYVFDGAGSCALRQITSSGVVSTLAGGTCGFADGTGASAKFSIYVPGLVYDSADSLLYVADKSNCAIRQVTLAGVVTTVVGNPPPTVSCGYVNGMGTTALISDPLGIAYDPTNQSLYVSNLSTVRQIALPGPGFLVSTLAGPAPPNTQTGFIDGSGAAARFHNINGIVYDTSDGNLYVTDGSNDAIRQVTLAGNVTTLAGASPATPGYGFSSGFGFAAAYQEPLGIAYDAATDSLYVSDELNYAIVQVQL